MVLKMLAKNKPLEYLEAKKADINEIRYMEDIKTMPMIAAIRFTLFMIKILSLDEYIHFFLSLY